MKWDRGAHWAEQGYRKEVKDPFLLALAYHRLLIEEEEFRSLGQPKKAEERKEESRQLRDKWQWDVLSAKEIQVRPEALWKTIAEPKLSLDPLPSGSFSIQFTFALRRPYLSLDEQSFYIIENPVRRDHVFGVPMVAPSSWKGCLRAALREIASERAVWLCGHEKGSDDFRAGRLQFFPTFFHRASLEMLNPHDRERRVGVNIILLEMVPIGTSGTFSLIYVPFDLVGGEGERMPWEVGKDLVATAKALRLLFTERGFGAKTSAGFGVARERLAGEGLLRLRIEEARVPLEPPTLPPECEPFLVEGEFPLLKPREWRERMGATKWETDAYKEAKAAYLAYQEALEAYEREMQAAKGAPRWWERSFATFDELVRRAEEAQEAIVKGRPVGGEKR